MSIKGLRKVYRDGVTAVTNLDLELADGAFFGLLGPNGAGKTTLIGSVCNIVRPTAGELTVFGHDYRTREARRLIGLAEQEINVDRFLSVRQLLVYHAGYHGIGRKTAVRRADELLETVRPRSTRPTGRAYELSGGMQRRLVLARALIHQPRLLILDEPTAGVDVALRSEIWRLVKGLNAAGTTILLTTHYLQEAETLCDEIALIAAGRIVDRGSAASLRHRYQARDISEVYDRVIDCGGRLVSDTDVKHLTPYDEPFEAERAPFLWLAEREVLRFLNIWPYAIAGPVLSTILFVIVFGSALGHRVAPIDGVAYGQFIVPGLFAQAILTVGFVNGTTSLFEARRDKYINDVFASPLRWWEINAALVTGGVVRGFIVGAGVLAIARAAHRTPAVVARPFVFVFGTLAVLLVAGQIGVIAGSLAKSLDHVYSMESIILLPLGFLGGVFYSVAAAAPRLGRAQPDQSRSSGWSRWSGSVVLGHADVGAGVRAGRGVGAGGGPVGLVGGHLRHESTQGLKT